MMIVITQIIINKEKNDLKMIFLMLDKNGNGVLTQDELLDGYRKLYKSNEKAIAEVKYLKENGYLGTNETINYTEFLITLEKKKQELSKEDAKNAFNH